MVLCAKINTAASAAGLFGNIAAGAGAMMWQGTGTLRSVFHPGVAEMLADPILTGGLEIWTVRRTTTPMLYVGGKPRDMTGTSASLVTPGGSGILTVGGATTVAGYSQCDITFALMVDREITSAEQSLLEYYLRMRYAI